MLLWSRVSIIIFKFCCMFSWSCWISFSLILQDFRFTDSLRFSQSGCNEVISIDRDTRWLIVNRGQMTISWMYGTYQFYCILKLFFKTSLVRTYIVKFSLLNVSAANSKIFDLFKRASNESSSRSLHLTNIFFFWYRQS